MGASDVPKGFRADYHCRLLALHTCSLTPEMFYAVFYPAVFVFHSALPVMLAPLLES